MKRIENEIVLSLFPGIGLLDRAFESEGFFVLQGPDLLLGRDIREFNAPAGVFDGVIGGSPCQDFSRARRCDPTGDGLAMMEQFARVVTQAKPAWFVHENVIGVPDCHIDGYTVQRINLNARECGSRQNRPRVFQWGSRSSVTLWLDLPLDSHGTASRCCMASEGQRGDRRSFADFCELQGLPRSFDLPAFTKSAKYRAVGNGVTLQMGRVIAIAVKHRCDTPRPKVCVCNCGRPITGKQEHASAACRKRMERRRRDTAAVSTPGPVTPA